MNLIFPKPFIKRLFTTILIINLITGCQLTQPKHSAANLGSYYLWLNQLTTEQLSEELALQKSLIDQPQTEAYLAILYSRAKSGIFNPYRAKAILNRLTEPNKAQLQFSVYHLPASDLAFLSMLKEQLNEQLLAIESTVSKEQKIHLMQQHINSISHKSKQLELATTKLEQKNNELRDKNRLLNNKINQLKNIEQAINKRGN